MGDSPNVGRRKEEIQMLRHKKNDKCPWPYRTREKRILSWKNKGRTTFDVPKEPEENEKEVFGIL